MNMKESEFRELLETTHLPTVAVFSASWCGPCRNFAPIFAKVAEKLGASVVQSKKMETVDKLSRQGVPLAKQNGLNFAKLDIDDCPQICEDINIDVVPTIVIFTDGQVTARHRGAFPNEKAFEDYIKEHVAK